MPDLKNKVHFQFVKVLFVVDMFESNPTFALDQRLAVEQAEHKKALQIFIDSPLISCQEKCTLLGDELVSLNSRLSNPRNDYLNDKLYRIITSVQIQLSKLEVQNAYNKFAAVICEATKLSPNPQPEQLTLSKNLIEKCLGMLREFFQKATIDHEDKMHFVFCCRELLNSKLLRIQPSSHQYLSFQSINKFLDESCRRFAGQLIGAPEPGVPEVEGMIAWSFPPPPFHGVGPVRVVPLPSSHSPFWGSPPIPDSTLPSPIFACLAPPPPTSALRQPEFF